MNYKLLIADTDENYVNNVICYLQNHMDISIDILGFSKRNILEEYEFQNEVLLICPEFLDDAIRGKTDNIIILSKGNIQKEYANYPCVYKYSRVQDIWKQIVNTMSELDILLSKGIHSNTNIIGVYSPIGQSGKTILSVTISEVLSKQTKVLLINLESYSTLEKILGVEEDGDLAELILYAKQKYSNIALKIEMLKKRKSYNFDFLPTITHNEDLLEASYEDWNYIIGQAMEKLDYGYIVIDIGENPHLLKLCNKIIVPISSSTTSITKFQKWRINNNDFIKDMVPVMTGFIEGNMVPNEIPDLIMLPYMPISSNNLYPSELGDIVRRCSK